MIRYALACAAGHPFEAWFASSAAYDEQAAAGQVECPFCASREVRKQIMAPAVASGRRREPAAGGARGADGEAVSLMMAAAERVRAHLEANFEDVGAAFAREARAIHEGQREPRGIYGRATPEEVRDLAEDGVPVTPLPPALAPRRREEVN